jgi:hypothetical protein
MKLNDILTVPGTCICGIFFQHWTPCCRRRTAWLEMNEQELDPDALAVVVDISLCDALPNVYAGERGTTNRRRRRLRRSGAATQWLVIAREVIARKVGGTARPAEEHPGRPAERPHAVSGREAAQSAGGRKRGGQSGRCRVGGAERAAQRGRLSAGGASRGQGGARGYGRRSAGSS